MVDDASDPPVVAMPERTCCGSTRNGGPAAARTAGLDAVRTELVAFVDTDVDAEPGWLSRVARSLRRPAGGARRTAGRQRRRRARRQRIGGRLRAAAFPARPRAARRGGWPRAPGSPTCRRPRSVARVDGHHGRRRVRPGAARRRGRRPRVAARRGRAGGFATSRRCRCSTRPRRLVAGARPPARRLRRARRQRWPRRHGGAVAPVRTSPWTLGVWGLVVAGQPLAALGLAAATAGALVHKLRGVPPGDSLRLAATGHAYAGLTLADAVRRCWLPLALVAARRSRRVRVVTLAALVPALVDGGGRTPARRRGVRARACGGAWCDGARSVRCSPSWCRGPGGGRSRLHLRTPVRPVRSPRDVAAPRRFAPVERPGRRRRRGVRAPRPGRQGQRLRVRPRCPRRAGRGARRPLPPGGRAAGVGGGHGARARPGSRRRGDPRC